MNVLKGSDPLRLLARVLDVPRSGLYYRKRAGAGGPLRERLRVIDPLLSRCGYRRLGVLLRAEGFSVGDRKVHALMRQEDLLVPRRVAKPRATLSLEEAGIPNRRRGFPSPRVNPVWVADRSYVRTGEGFAYGPFDPKGDGVCPGAQDHRASTYPSGFGDGPGKGRPEVQHSDRGCSTPRCGTRRGSSS